MAIIVIIGYVAASSPPVKRLIDGLASVRKTGRDAIAYIAFVSMLYSLLNWALSLMFVGLSVRSLAQRSQNGRPLHDSLPYCRNFSPDTRVIDPRSAQRYSRT